MSLSPQNRIVYKKYKTHIVTDERIKKCIENYINFNAKRIKKERELYIIQQEQEQKKKLEEYFLQQSIRKEQEKKSIYTNRKELAVSYAIIIFQF